ncbi:MAG TPA: hypothetical protein ENH12_01315, partial [Proteobacteria bacterium]|nr:hypothetical protein [Pseudomonadota bacterium]
MIFTGAVLLPLISTADPVLFFWKIIPDELSGAGVGGRDGGVKTGLMVGEGTGVTARGDGVGSGVGGGFGVLVAEGVGIGVG